MSGRPRRKDPASSSRRGGRAQRVTRGEQGPGGGQDTPAAATPHGNAPGPTTARVDITERPARTAGSGAAFLALILYLALIIGAIAAIARVATDAFDKGEPAAVTLAVGASVVVVLTLLLMFTSLVVVVPGQTSVRQFFGRYIGTVRRPGIALVPPLTNGKKVSVKVHNFETSEIKVNDLDGNPIDIAAIVVWQVTDTARAVFAVEAYEPEPSPRSSWPPPSWWTCAAGRRPSASRPPKSPRPARGVVKPPGRRTPRCWSRS